MTNYVILYSLDYRVWEQATAIYAKDRHTAIAEARAAGPLRRGGFFQAVPARYWKSERFEEEQNA